MCWKMRKAGESGNGKRKILKILALDFRRLARNF